MKQYEIKHISDGLGILPAILFPIHHRYTHGILTVPSLARNCMPYNLQESQIKYQFNVKSVISYQSEIDALNHFGIDLSTLLNGVNKDIKITIEYISFT